MSGQGAIIHNLKLTIRYVLAVFLLLSVPGCRSSNDAQKANALVAEANGLLEQEAKAAREWSAEYAEVFTPQNRSRFPSNRDALRPHAKNLIGRLDRSAALNSEAAAKYEEASRLLTDDKARRYSALLAASFLKDVEVAGLFKEQMKLVLDDGLKDQRTFNEKFIELTRVIEQKVKERNELQAEGKKVMGM